MKISDIYKNSVKPLTSFEIFPPKGELNLDELDTTLTGLKQLNPAFISVTYSAGGTGGNSEKTSAICNAIDTKYGIPSMAHLTCINSDRAKIDYCIDMFKRDGIENVLALRGDIVEGCEPGEFKHASELIPILKDAGFCVGAACYPEGHVSCVSLEDDMKNLLIKQDLGADFFVSQLFFSNSAYLDFFKRAKDMGITVPIEAGVMPIMSKSQTSRMVFMCGASLPSEIVRILNRYESNEDLQKAGIEYAARQIIELRDSGVDAVHIYTMNKPDVAKGILEIVNG